MTSVDFPPLLLEFDRPSRLAGVLVAIASVAATTGAIYPLRHLTPVLSLGVLYVLAVVVVSMFWGLAFGIGTSVLSAGAFNFFHLPPGGRLVLADDREWVALLVFVVVAVATGMLAELARVRGREAEQRRQEADRAAEAAQLLLGAAHLETAALRRSDELKTALLRSVSHDLRTPLTAILMAATALDPERPTSENVGDVREQVIDAATRLWGLIEKLLDLSVLQAGSTEPREVWYSIDEVLQEAVAQAGGEPGAFKLSVERNMPLLRGDPGQLERAFVNVLENAARYRGERPVSVRARTVRERIRVLIADEGPGIPRGEQERIFLPFYRAPGASSEHSGSGLGLAIAKGFVELNGGRVAIESQPGQGTSVVVEFPLVEQEAAPAVPASPVAAGKPAAAVVSATAGASNASTSQRGG
jgi:two-component system sensor histidine kinase KdpD